MSDILRKMTKAMEQKNALDRERLEYTKRLIELKKKYNAQLKSLIDNQNRNVVYQEFLDHIENQKKINANSLKAVETKYEENEHKEIKLLIHLQYDTIFSFEECFKGLLFQGIKIEENYTQFKFRSFIRSVFSFIEGGTSALSNMLAEDYKKNPGNRLASKKIERLQEKKSLMAIDKKIELLINCYNKYYDIVYSISDTKEIWEDFLEKKKLRNRITHPKTIEEMGITLDDIKDVYFIYLWFQKIILDIRKQAINNKSEPLESL